MTLNDLQGHSPNVSLSKCDFFFVQYSRVAVDKISTDSRLRGPSAIALLLLSEPAKQV